MRDWSQQQSPSEVVAVLSDLVLHPAQTFCHSWNWKAALLSAMLRVPLFLVATLRQGLDPVSIAVFAEAVYSASISGCYGAAVQKLRHARPLWASGLLWFDYSLHLFTGMANLKGGMRLQRTFPFMMRSTPNFGPWTHLPAFLPTLGLRPQPFMPIQ